MRERGAHDGEGGVGWAGGGVTVAGGEGDNARVLTGYSSQFTMAAVAVDAAVQATTASVKSHGARGRIVVRLATGGGTVWRLAHDPLVRLFRGAVLSARHSEPAAVRLGVGMQHGQRPTSRPWLLAVDHRALACFWRERAPLVCKPVDSGGDGRVQVCRQRSTDGC